MGEWLCFVLFFEEVSNFSEELNIWGYYWCLRLFYFGFFLTSLVNCFDNHKNCKCNDHEVDNNCNKIPITYNYFFLSLYNSRKSNTEVRKIDIAYEPSNRWHNDIFNKRSNNLSKSRTNNNTHSKIDNIPFHGKITEFFEYWHKKK